MDKTDVEKKKKKEERKNKKKKKGGSLKTSNPSFRKRVAVLVEKRILTLLIKQKKDSFSRDMELEEKRGCVTHPMLRVSFLL